MRTITTYRKVGAFYIACYGKEAVMGDMRQGTTTGYRRYGAELGLQRNYRQGHGFANQGTQFVGRRCIA